MDHDGIATDDNPYNLLLSKSTIDYTNQTSFFIFNTEAKRIVLESNALQPNNRKASKKSEINFSIQKYLYNHTTQTFTIYNTEYKNQMKKTPNNMKQEEESILKQCLLQLSNDKSVLFILPISLCEKEVTDSALKMKMPIDLLKAHYDDSVYYKIDVIHIMIEMPSEPNLFNDYPDYIHQYIEEVRYLTKEKFYSAAEKCANTIIGNIFNMRKDKRVNLDEETKQKLFTLMKPIVLNKTLCITLRDGDPIQKNKQCEEAIKCIEKEYYPYFANDNDEYFLKITGRYAMYALRIRNFEKAHKALNDLKQKYDNSNEIIVQLENEIKKFPPIRTKEQLEKSFIKAIINKNDKRGIENGKEKEMEYEWEIASLNVLNYINTELLEPGVINILSK